MEEGESRHARKGDTAAAEVPTHLQRIAASIKPSEESQVLYTVKLFHSVARYVQVPQGAR